MRFNEDTKTYKVFSALQSGEALTPAQAQHRFGVKNLSAEVSRIRQSGFAVYANSRKAGTGVKVTEYVIGKPSRKIVAAGYRAMAFRPRLILHSVVLPKSRCNAGFLFGIMC